MAGSATATFVLVFLLTVFLQRAAAHRVHVVGDSTGWKVPEGGAKFYADWACRNNFVVGDSLSFNFKTDKHSVVEVSKESFEKCNSDTAIDNVITTSPAKVKITSAGEHYYICTRGKHCKEGQKLSVTASAAESALPPPSDTPQPPSSSSNDAESSHYALFWRIVSRVVLRLLIFHEGRAQRR